MLRSVKVKYPIMLALMCLSLLTAACATHKPMPLNTDITCEQIEAEIDKTRMALYDEKKKQSGQGSDIAETAADVAVLGAGVAGVPYVGSVYSIGKAIFSHTKRTATSQLDLYQIHLDELEYLAERKECYLQF